MALTYSSWLAEAANLLGTSAANPNLLVEVPAAIDYAEGRIFRDLDLIAQITRDSTQSCVPNSRNITPPSAFIVISAVNVITPAGSTPDNGERNGLVKTSSEVLDALWSSATGATVPARFAYFSQGWIAGASPSPLILLGPWPDQNYTVEIIGTQRPAPLSATNTVTFLTVNLAELFLVATMVHLTGFQKNFGAQADDPKSSVSWEGQYGTLIAKADKEELRKRYAGSTFLSPPGMDRMAPPAQAAR